MAYKISNTFVFGVVLILLFACKNDSNTPIFILNKCKKDVAITFNNEQSPKCINLELNIERDKLATDSLREYYLSFESWPKFINEYPSKKLYVYIILIDSLKKYNNKIVPWIIKNKVYFKRDSFLLEQLVKQNWKIIIRE